MTILVACGLRREAGIIKRTGVIPVVGGGSAARLQNTLEDTITAYASEGWRFAALLSCGVAGALDPSLRAGDVVVGSLYIRHAGLVPASTAPQATAEHVAAWTPEQVRGDKLVAWLARHLPDAHRGTVFGTDSIIAAVAEKAALHASTGAIAVDMESHIAARVAARHDLPFAILRTISDTADHPLPPAARVGMRPDGGVALGAVLASLARDPAQLPALIRTGRDAGKAFASLRRALDALEALGIGRLDPLQLALDME